MVSIRLVKLPHQQQKFPTGVDNMFGGGGVMGGGGRGGGGEGGGGVSGLLTQYMSGAWGLEPVILKSS